MFASFAFTYIFVAIEMEVQIHYDADDGTIHATCLDVVIGYPPFFTFPRIFVVDLTEKLEEETAAAASTSSRH